MGKYLTLVAGASVLAFLFPSAFDQYRKQVTDGQRAEALDPAPAPVEAALPVPAPASPGRVARLAAGSDGHYRTQARINGRPVDVLVDTGATYVSINEATARRLGVWVRPSDFRYTASTANGETKVAVAKLDRVQVGLVELRDVDVLVSPGNGLSTTLLGMSFLNRLKRFEVQADKLNLFQ